MADDGFEKVEPPNLIVIGGAAKQTKAFGGLLIDIVPDEQYPKKMRYIAVGRDGIEYEIAGNAALSRRIKRSHIGCLIKLTFEGIRQAGSNKFKVIAVLAQPRSRTTDEQKVMFPRWHDFDQVGDDEGHTNGDEAPPEGGEAPPVNHATDF